MAAVGYNIRLMEDIRGDLLQDVDAIGHTDQICKLQSLLPGVSWLCRAA